VAIDVRAGRLTDVDVLVDAFAALGWRGKDRALYLGYVDEQARGERLVLVAEDDNVFAGYVCVVWRSTYAPFVAFGIPEISDLNVLPAFRRRGIGTELMSTAEAAIRPRSVVAGLGVGLSTDYAPALMFYLGLGYRPDGRGVAYAGRTAVAGETLPIDDSFTLMLTRSLSGQ
jgi:GNAT superfamily N-acetyltransferase